MLIIYFFLIIFMVEVGSAFLNYQYSRKPVYYDNWDIAFNEEFLKQSKYKFTLKIISKIIIATWFYIILLMKFFENIESKDFMSLLFVILLTIGILILKELVLDIIGVINDKKSVVKKMINQIAQYLFIISIVVLISYLFSFLLVFKSIDLIIVITSIVIILNLMFHLFLANIIFGKSKTDYELENQSLQNKINEILIKMNIDNITIKINKKDKKELSASFIASKQENTIYLSEYLINELNEEEICSVIAHELGHYINKDLYYEIVFSTIHIILNGLLLLILNYFYGNIIISLGLYIILFHPFNLFIKIPFKTLSRKMEFMADKVSCKFTSVDDNVSALKKAVKYNLLNVNPHPLFVILKYSHPGIITRVKKMKKE